jgi:hypothetical protein
MLLYDSPNHTLLIGTIANKISKRFGVPVNKLVYPERISTLLDHDPYFIKASKQEWAARSALSAGPGSGAGCS